jgi:threonine dehydratase
MITLADVRSAREVIRDHIIRTPLVFSPTFSAMTGAEVYLKLETMQKAGSFKVRGAMNRILSHIDEIGREGVVAASAGNHAQGVAVAAQAAGLPATIVMPEGASVSKQAATRGYGAEVILKGRTLAEAIEHAMSLSSGGKTFIHPYDDPFVIAGQGTIALEILEDLPDPDLIIVPVGGGGLISGIAVAGKGIRKDTGIIGVQAAACPSAERAFHTGTITRVEVGPSIADGILAKEIGAATFEIIRNLVDDIVLVGEEEIADAMVLLLERKKVLAEGAGATPLSALLSGRVKRVDGRKVVLVVSGGNVDIPLLDRIIHRGLVKNGRCMNFSLLLKDSPGALGAVLAVLSGSGGNILAIRHARTGLSLPLYLVRVEFELETRDHDHIRQINSDLRDAGFRMEQA